MRSLYPVLILAPSLFVLCSSGCGSGGGNADAPDPKLADQRAALVLAQTPDGAMCVVDARAAAEKGEPLVVTGKIGAEGHETWHTGFATFVMSDDAAHAHDHDAAAHDHATEDHGDADHDHAECDHEDCDDENCEHCAAEHSDDEHVDEAHVEPLVDEHAGHDHAEADHADHDHVAAASTNDTQPETVADDHAGHDHSAEGDPEGDHVHAMPDQDADEHDADHDHTAEASHDAAGHDDAHAGHAHGDTHGTCPFCKQAAMDMKPVAIVQFVNDRGEVLPLDAQKLFGLTEGQTVTVQGTGKVDSSNGYLIINATAIHIGS